MDGAHPDLLHRARAGDEMALDALFGPLIEPAFRIAFGLLHDRQLAEDAVQEAALRAWHKLSQLRDGAGIRPWFFEFEDHPERLVEGERRGAERRLLRLGTVLAQAVHVGNHHRAQICMILASLDIEPPSLDTWAYGAHLAERGDRERWRRDAV